MNKARLAEAGRGMIQIESRSVPRTRTGLNRRYSPQGEGIIVIYPKNSLGPLNIDRALDDL